MLPRSVYAESVYLSCSLRQNTKNNGISFLFPLSSQGIKQTDHFGFICRDPIDSGPSQYACYVFQCASESLVSGWNGSSVMDLWLEWSRARLSACVQVDEVMLTLKQAFSTAAALQSNKTQIQLCEACPMHGLHKLCERIEGKPP